jgi:uncharacterized lipoprotein YajG
VRVSEIWGAQAASLQFLAALPRTYGRSTQKKLTVYGASFSNRLASCQTEQAGSLCSPDFCITDQNTNVRNSSVLIRVIRG